MTVVGEGAADGGQADEALATATAREPKGTVRGVLLAFLRLGLTSFGGPIAHLGYFQEEFVRRRGWLTATEYADIVAFCQALPGPTSSQVGLMIGRRRAGVAGALAAWSGFTLPSAALLVAAALGLGRLDSEPVDRAIHGLMVAAVAVVALAIWGMARPAWGNRSRASLGIAAAAVLFVWQGPIAQVLVIVVAALIGVIWFHDRAAPVSPDTGSVKGVIRSGGRFAPVCLAVFVVLLVVLPVVATVSGWRAVELADGFYRAGSLVFGGGHVVLPLLEAEVVPPGWVSPDDVTAGYGLAQAVPGPLFTYASYLGAATGGTAFAGLGLAITATVAIFLPSFLLILGLAPYWDALRRSPSITAARAGINAAVVGVLLAALYDPIWTTAIGRPADVALALVAFGALAWWRVPAWGVVTAAALAGLAFAP